MCVILCGILLEAQNDVQGRYDLLNGNWISGIPFIDSIRLGNQSELSDDAF